MLFTSSFSKLPIHRESEGRGDSPDDIRFDAARIVTGITFHLFDEELATSVDAAAVLHTVHRLIAQNVHARVARRTWHALDGRGRLEWLLRHGRTRVVIGRDGCATLTPPPKSLW